MVVGVPVRVAGNLYNCAAVIHNGKLSGLVPKIHLPGYNEFYESRWFSSGLIFCTILNAQLLRYMTTPKIAVHPQQAQK